MSVFIASHNIISSLGFSTDENLQHLFNGETGIRMMDNEAFSPEPIPTSLVDQQLFAKLIDAELPHLGQHTFFDQLMLLSAHLALKDCSVDTQSADTLFILSTTKGNVGQLGLPEVPESANLWWSADLLRNHFKNPNKAVVVSTACVSGVAAIVAGKRLIDAGRYKNVVVVGADVFSRFVVAGFQSFHSLSPQPCRPFHAERDGLTLGEGAATVVLTSDKSICPATAIEVVSGATSNDANHISGPSRTGEGLLIAIRETLKGQESVDFISAHGTATPYNDDMESKAIFRAGLSHVPVNSMKGYIGHTLGAAGVIETIAHAGSMVHHQIIPTLQYGEFGVAENINIASTKGSLEMKHVLKLASGFGGSNAALLLRKH
jgi:3-oxoacyl-[acyl-carrier-protein] synthase-1